MTDPVNKPAGYIVRVDTVALARNLADRYGGRWDDRAAARWLTQSYQAEDHPFPDHSPFVQTDDFGVYYTAEDPATWLEPDEIVSVGPADREYRHPYGKRAARAA